MPKIILRGPDQVSYAIAAISQAPENSVVTVLRPTRSNQQNAKMWAMLEDVSRSEPEGRKWTKDTWKAALMHSLGHQIQFADGLDGAGPFPVGFRSSSLTIQQMADLIEVIYEYGSRHGVEWRESDRSGALA